MNAAIFVSEHRPGNHGAVQPIFKIAESYTVQLFLYFLTIQ